MRSLDEINRDNESDGKPMYDGPYGNPCTVCAEEEAEGWARIPCPHGTVNPNVAHVPTPDPQTLRRWGILLGIVKDPGLFYPQLWGQDTHRQGHLAWMMNEINKRDEVER